MAVTKTHPIKSTLKAAIDYICNPEKTDGKLLVSSYGCAAETADIEFAWTRRHAIDKGTNLGRHLIQAFQPGEVTPEQAHEIGMELAKEILGGKYEFVLTTHIDKDHVHNHLIFNAVSFADHKHWYANQFKYQKVDGTPPGEELKKTTYSMEELGQRLGLKEATAYELVAKGHFDVVDVLGKRRVTKESFERWYASQTDYRTVEDQELDADIMASTYGLPEMARMLGVHRQTIYYIVANEDFELIKVGRYKRATKESFEKWYQNQTRYQLAEDRQERS